MAKLTDSEQMRRYLQLHCAGGCNCQTCEDVEKTWIVARTPDGTEMSAWLCTRCSSKLLDLSKQALSMGSVVYYPDASDKDGGKHEG